MTQSKKVLLRAFLLMLLFAPDATRAQDGAIELVDDLVEEASFAEGLQPFSMVEVDGTLYFIGEHALTGRELWRSDGTPEGTRLVADSCPGPCGIHSLEAFDGAIFFESCDAADVCQLWRSDGTAEGTAALSSFSHRNARVSHLTAWNGALYFVASDPEHGAELRRIDSAAEESELVVDLEPGPADASIRRLAVAVDRLYFEAADGEEFWTTDGTESGTILLNGAVFGNFTSSPILTAGNRAFYVLRHFELWTSDGTPGGTLRIRDSDRVINLLATFNGDAYFTQLSEDFQSNELWISDGSAAGTRRLLGGFPFTSAPAAAVEYLGELHFVTREGLYKTDGTTAGTVLIDNFGGPIRGLGVSGTGDELFVGSMTGLYRLTSDGEPELITDAFSAGAFAPFRDGVAFVARSQALGGELAVVTGGSVQVLSDVEDPGSTGPRELTPGGDGLVFVDSLVPPGVWTTAGTASTTRLLESFTPYTGFSRGGPRIVSTRSGALVVEDDLWRVDPAGLIRLFDDAPDGVDVSRWLLDDSATAFGDGLAFLVWNFQDDRIELWSSDGTAAGTRRLDELMEFFFCFICDPPEPLPTWGVVAARDRLFAYFAGRLWVTDGRPGAARELDLGETCDSCDLGPVAAVGRKIFFGAVSSPFYAPPPVTRRLWVSDGTDGGTLVVREFDPPRPDGRAAALSEMLAVGKTLYFTAETAGLGDELWRSDGTPAGTFPVADLRPGGESSNPRELTLLGGRLYFAADDGLTGRELWGSDGTAAGTRLIADLRPGAASSFPGELVAIDKRLYFAADDGISGLEPWTSDGTLAGTRRLEDLQPGPLPSSPSSFVAAGERLYFAAGTEETGFELWTMPRPSCASCVLRSFTLLGE